MDSAHRLPFLKLLARFCLFGLLLAACYLLCLFAVADLPPLRDRLAQWNASVRKVSPNYYSVQRRAEAKEKGEVDVLFMGSSLCYRGLDAREFEQVGLKAFNLGSFNQQPLNTYYVFQDYAPKLQPKVLVYVVSVFMMPYDSVESAYDFISSDDVSPNLLRMCLLTRNIPLINTAIARYFNPDFLDLGSVRSKPNSVDRYVAGGFVERFAVPSPEQRHYEEPKQGKVRQEHLDYLEKLVSDARSRGLKVIFVEPPMPEVTRARFETYPQVHGAVAALAERLGVDYHDFNAAGYLPENHHYYDYGHLVPEGAAALSREVVKIVQAAL